MKCKNKNFKAQNYPNLNILSCFFVLLCSFENLKLFCFVFLGVCVCFYVVVVVLILILDLLVQVT